MKPIGGRFARGIIGAFAFLAAGGIGASISIAGPLQVAEMQGADTCVALTFDDGPDVDLTPKLLSILESKGVTATFFVVGYRAALWPDIVRRAASDGFEIGNHSWNHPVLTGLATESAARQISRTDDQVNQIIGHRPSVIRAPYGSLSWRIASVDSRTFVGWDVDTEDWLHFSQLRITDRAVNRARNGSIILMHDIHRTTIAAVDGIIDGLRARGFRFVTVSALLGGVCGGTPVSEEVANEGPLIHRIPPPATDEIAMAPSATHHTRAQRPAADPAPSSMLLGFLPGGTVPNMTERPKAFFVGQ